MNLQITHKVDNDGEFCRTLYKIFFKNELSKCYRVDYAEKRKILKYIAEGDVKYDDVYITDISLTKEDKEILKQLADKISGKIYVIDHHKYTLDYIEEIREYVGDKLISYVVIKENDVFVSAAHNLLTFLEQRYPFPTEYNKDTVHYVTSLVSEMDTFTFKKKDNEYSRRVQFLYAVDSVKCQLILDEYMKQEKSYIKKYLEQLDVTALYEDLERFKEAILNESEVAEYDGNKVVILCWPKLKYKKLKPICLEKIMNEKEFLPICFMLEGDVYRLTSGGYDITELGNKLNMGVNKPLHVSLVKRTFISRNNLENLEDKEMKKVVKKLIEGLELQRKKELEELI